MNAELHRLAEREGLPYEIARDTLQRLVIEAVDRDDRQKNVRAMAQEEGNLEPLARLDEQRQRKNERWHRLKCQACGDPFTAARQHARFCSTACRVQACRKRRVA